MKTIIIDGKEFQYAVFRHDCSEYGETYSTKFFHGVKKVPVWDLFFIKSKKLVERPIYAFTVYFDITDPSFSKKYTTKAITKAYEEWTGHKSRKDEIERGEII